MKPRYRYNWKTNKWDEVVRINTNFIYINPNGVSVELPYYLLDAYKSIVSNT